MWMGGDYILPSVLETYSIHYPTFRLMYVIRGSGTVIAHENFPESETCEHEPQTATNTLHNSKNFFLLFFFF